MYTKYKLRNAKELVTPKGPSFARAKTITCDIDGTVISFRVPKHRPEYSNNTAVMPKRWYTRDEMFFQSNYSKDSNVRHHWDYLELLKNSWTFYGPWFTGILADLTMFLTLIKPVNYEQDDFSLFHPRALENIIGDYLTNMYASHTSETSMGIKHKYIAPLNWQPLTGLPVLAVSLQVEADPAVFNQVTKHFAFFPLADKTLLCMQFYPSRFLRLSEAEHDKRVSKAPLLELIHNIIHSFQLTLSPEMLAQQKAALAGLDDTSLIKEYLPLQWPIPEPEKQEPIMLDDEIYHAVLPD